MNKKIFLLAMILFTSLTSCQKELIKIDYNEFTMMFPPDECDGINICNYQKDVDGFTICLVSVESVISTCYTQSKTYYVPYSIAPYAKSMNLKGYDNGIRLIIVKFKVVEDFYSKNNENLSFYYQFYLNISSTKIYEFSLLYNFFSNIDKMLLYFETNKLVDREFYTADTSQNSIIFENCHYNALPSYRRLMPFINDKLDFNFYTNTLGEIPDEYTKYY